MKKLLILLLIVCVFSSFCFQKGDKRKKAFEKFKVENARQFNKKVKIKVIAEEFEVLDSIKSSDLVKDFYTESLPSDTITRQELKNSIAIVINQKLAALKAPDYKGTKEETDHEQLVISILKYKLKRIKMLEQQPPTTIEYYVAKVQYTKQDLTEKNAEPTEFSDICLISPNNETLVSKPEEEFDDNQKEFIQTNTEAYEEMLAVKYALGVIEKRNKR